MHGRRGICRCLRVHVSYTSYSCLSSSFTLLLSLSLYISLSLLTSYVFVLAKTTFDVAKHSIGPSTNIIETSSSIIMIY